LPVRVLWSFSGYEEAVALDRDVLYVIGGEVTAIRVSDGTRKWAFVRSDGAALEASGGVVVGLADSKTVRVFAPTEFDLRIDRETGALVDLQNRTGAHPSPGLARCPPAPSKTFRVETDLEETPAYWPDGRMAWKIVVDTPSFDEGDPIEASGVLLLPLPTGDLVALALPP